jgi:hypothetical protein
MFEVFGPGSRRSATSQPVPGPVRGTVTTMPIETARSPR